MKPLCVIELHDRAHQIGIALTIEQAVEQHALLQGAQWVYVLNRRRTSTNRADQSIDLLLLQRY